MNPTTNIFERVAQTLESDLQPAFKGNKPSSNFLRLSVSTDSKQIGRRFPQVEYINLMFAHLLQFDELFKPPLKFEKIELYKSSKLTDCISTAAISAHAFILSKKALNVFQQFELGNYKIYPATVYHKGTGHEYGVLHFVNDLQPNLNFNESKFYVSNLLGGYEFDLHVDDIDDYEIKRQKVKNAEMEGTKKWWYLSLKYGVFEENSITSDLFTVFSSQTNPYVSKALGQAIVDNGLTGFDLERVYNIAD